MSFLRRLLKKKERPIHTYEDFWAWFRQHQKQFFRVVKDHNHIDEKFFDQLSPRLAVLKDGLFFQAGMYDEHTAELIITTDACVENIVFVEELVAVAPTIKGWRITALKPAMNIEKLSIDMDGLRFKAGNLFFYANELPAYPDEVDLCVVHSDMNDANRSDIINGTYLFLEHCLGELDLVTKIDSIRVVSTAEAEQELIPIERLKAYLTWRQKEFVEKYDRLNYDTSQDEYSLLEAEQPDGNPIVAATNTSLLQWEHRVSYPWMAVLTIAYNGKSNNGMPLPEDHEKINQIDDQLDRAITDTSSYLLAARRTGNNERLIFIVCKDFRQPSKILFSLKQQYHHLFDIKYSIYKDKYWQSLEQFQQG